MKKRAHKQTIAIAACVFDIGGDAVPTDIQLTPTGLFRARDGRPEGLPGWRIDHVIAQRVITRMADMAGDLVIDYEHQTLNAEKNGQPAPAAGWFKGARIEWREGTGLFATNVEWTDAARTLITSKEYRYLSPVIAYDKNTGEVLAILMVALTNYPAIDGLGDLAAVAAARFHLSTQSEEEETPVDRNQLIALLGLDDSATDEQIQQAIEALKAKAASVTALRSVLAIDEKDDLQEAVAALKTAATDKAPDPAKFVPVETVTALRNDVAALTAKLNGKEVDDLIDVALGEGKLLPAMEQWARDLGAKDIEALKGYLDKTPAIEALKGTQTKGKGPGDEGTAALTAEQQTVASMFGNSAEDLEKYGS